MRLKDLVGCTFETTRGFTSVCDRAYFQPTLEAFIFAGTSAFGHEVRFSEDEIKTFKNAEGNNLIFKPLTDNVRNLVDDAKSKIGMKMTVDTNVGTRSAIVDSIEWNFDLDCIVYVGTSPYGYKVRLLENEVLRFEECVENAEC